MTEKKEKKPLDLTSDEMAEFLFGQEAAGKLKEMATDGGKVPPPTGESQEAKGKSKSARKHGTT